MKLFAVILVFLAAARSDFAASAPRTLKDIPGARESLLRIVSLKFYQSLLISTVEG